MARPKGPHDDGKPPRKPPGPLGRLLLAAALPLPPVLSLQNIVNLMAAAAGACGRLLEALLLTTSPFVIIYLTWVVLEAGAGQGDGVQPPLLPGGLQLPRVPSPSMATAVALLAGASLSIHLAHAAWSQRRWRRQAVIASALTADFWEQRPAALEASGEDSFLSAALATALVAESHRSTSRGSSTQTGTGSEVDRPMVPSPFAMQRKLSMIKSASAPRDLLQHGGAVATWDPAGNDILHGRAGQDGVGGSGSGSAGRGNEADAAVICSRLKDLQAVLYGEEAAAAWADATPQTFESAVFETGRLCGMVGVESPPSGGAGTAAGVYDMLQKLTSALT